MVSVYFGLSVEKLVMCPISICAIEPPRRPWQVLTGKEAGGLQNEIIAAQIEMLNYLEQNDRHKFMWIHFRHCKGTSKKVLHQETEKSAIEFNLRAVDVWRAV